MTKREPETNRGFQKRKNMKADNDKFEALGVAGLPKDLTECVGKSTLLKLALDAVQTLDWSSTERNQRSEIRPQMMLTLLSYCYASGIHGSQDVAWAMQNDPTVRYICARTYPDWLSIRRFRRYNRQPLQQCLAYILKQTWALRFDEAETNYLGYTWFESELNQQIDAAVQMLMELAMLMDGVESE